MWTIGDPWAAAEALRGRCVLVAMSGGVDSSVAALLLQRRGARVIGLTMKNFCFSQVEAGARSCCSTTHLLDARRVCEPPWFMGILYTKDRNGVNQPAIHEKLR